MGKKKKDKIKKKYKNFCYACGLYLSLEASSTEADKTIEKYFKRLQDLGIRAKGKFSREIIEAKRTSKFCVLGNKIRAKKGKRKFLWMEKRCRDFQPKLPTLKTSDYIAFHISNKNSRKTNRLAAFALIIAIIGLAFILFGSEIKSFLKNLF